MSERPRDLSQVRAKAAEHNDEIDSLQWFTVADLAKRWRVSETTVRSIPADALRFKEFGNGEHLKRRRYRSDWVTAYEEARSAA